MKLGKNSIVVQTWFATVLNGMTTIENVPTIFGIRDAVQLLLDDMQPAQPTA